MTVTVVHRPSSPSVAASVIALGFVAVVLAMADFTAALVTLIAVPLFAMAGIWGVRRMMALGVMILLIGLILAAIGGAAVSTMLAAGVLAVTAWDLLDHGFSLGEHVGRSARTIRSELVHGAATVLVGTGTAAILLVGIELIPSGWPVGAVVFALLAGMFALLALEHQD